MRRELLALQDRSKPSNPNVWHGQVKQKLAERLTPFVVTLTSVVATVALLQFG